MLPEQSQTSPNDRQKVLVTVRFLVGAHPSEILRHSDHTQRVREFARYLLECLRGARGKIMAYREPKLKASEQERIAVIYFDSKLAE